MVQGDDGWDMPDWIRTPDEGWDAYHALRNRWNQFVGKYNAVVAPRMRNFGRPIAASLAQQAKVREPRKGWQLPPRQPKT